MAIYVFAFYTHGDDGFERDQQADAVMLPYSGICIGRGTDFETSERDIQWQVDDVVTATQAQGSLVRAGFRAHIRSY